MTWIALIDTTRHTAQAPPGRVVAGLSLLERAVRLAKVSGCARAVVLAHTDDLAPVGSLVEAIDFGIDLELVGVSTRELPALITEAAGHFELGAARGLLYLRSSTVYDRGLIHAHQPARAELDDFMTGATTADATPADVFEVSAKRWPEFLDACSAYQRANDPTPDTPGEFSTFLVTLSADLAPTDKWQVRVVDDPSARVAADHLWQGCRKPVDGIVSRLLNRYISIAISRSIVATGIHPNHISIVTFSLGILAAVFAAMGGYLWFVLAGLAYQANSVVDGVDGELARVKYEFSLLGEWLDTLSDDTKDVLFYAGLGVGAWRTVAFPWGLDSSIWLWLGGIAVAGKLVSMAAYYSWLIANKRGDLLAFEWSFENREESEETGLSRLLSVVKYATKNDFIVFLAMVMAFLSALPYFLFIVAPGQFVIATSVIVQRLQGSKE